MHFITGKHIERRAFLRGLSGAVALPFLDAMVPAGRPWRDRTLEPGQTRLICMEEAMGAAGASPWGYSKNLFAPVGVGRDFAINPDNQLRSIEQFREYLTVVSNTDCRMAEPFSAKEIGGDHDRSASVLLTQSHAKQTKGGSDIYAGRSLDQYHAQRYGQDTALPSLELAIEAADRGGGCNYDYHCAYAYSISWKSPTEPLPTIREPRVVFERLFGAGDSAQDRVTRRRTQASILDWLAGEVGRLKLALGAADRTALDQYLGDVREVERRIAIVEGRNASGDPRALPEAPQGVPDSWMEHMELMFDLQLLAFQGDVTRVITFKTGVDLSNRSFPDSGVNKSFHSASHHGNAPEPVLEFNRINSYRLSAVNYLLQKLKDTPEAGVPLIDKTAVVWGSGMGDPNLHAHRKCPLILMGKANGALQGNVHLKAPDATPMANALLTLLHGIGHDDMEGFGDSTSAFPLNVPAGASPTSSIGG
jgi:hypothetical protein